MHCAVVLFTLRSSSIKEGGVAPEEVYCPPFFALFALSFSSTNENYDRKYLKLERSHEKDFINTLMASPLTKGRWVVRAKGVVHPWYGTN